MDAEKISRIDDPQALKNLKDNARRLGRDDIYWLAFRRLSELEGMQFDDPMERAFHDVLNAYEQLLTEKNGRTTSASRTRQKLKNKGVRQCLIDWTMGQPTDGFRLLVDKGLVELTAEYLVIRFAERFPSDAVEAARKRLQEADVADP